MFKAKGFWATVLNFKDQAEGEAAISLVILLIWQAVYTSFLFHKKINLEQLLIRTSRL